VRTLTISDPALLGAASWAERVKADGALVAWPMQETSGTTLHDVSGNGRDATLGGTVTVGASGPTGATKAVAFGGGYGSIAYASWMNTPSLTVEVMFKTAGIAAQKWLVVRDGAGGSNRPFVTSVASAGNCYGYGNNQTGPAKTTTATGLDDGNWHFFGWGVDSGGSGYHVVDGAVDNTYTGGGTITQPSAININIGRNDLDGSNNWPGSLAFIAIFPTKLTTAQVLAHRLAIIG